MSQRTQMLQRTRRNTIGRRSTRVRMTFSIIFFTKEKFFMVLKFTCTVYKGSTNQFYILFKLTFFMVTLFKAVVLERITPMYIYFNIC
jgi:hypothetical protein